MTTGEKVGTGVLILLIGGAIYFKFIKKGAEVVEAAKGGSGGGGPIGLSAPVMVAGVNHIIVGPKATHNNGAAVTAPPKVTLPTTPKATLSAAPPTGVMSPVTVKKPTGGVLPALKIGADGSRNKASRLNLTNTGIVMSADGYKWKSDY